jgi:hypothetical protein
MATKTERQEQLDKRRWIRSEKAKADMGGTFEYCNYCNYKSKPINTPYYNGVPHCNTTYEQRVQECPCAVAYVKWSHRNRNK